VWPRLTAARCVRLRGEHGAAAFPRGNSPTRRALRWRQLAHATAFATVCNLHAGLAHRQPVQRHHRQACRHGCRPRCGCRHRRCWRGEEGLRLLHVLKPCARLRLCVDNSGYLSGHGAPTTHLLNLLCSSHTTHGAVALFGVNSPPQTIRGRKVLNERASCNKRMCAPYTPPVVLLLVTGRVPGPVLPPPAATSNTPTAAVGWLASRSSSRARVATAHAAQSSSKCSQRPPPPPPMPMAAAKLRSSLHSHAKGRQTRRSSQVSSPGR